MDADSRRNILERTRRRFSYGLAEVLRLLTERLQLGAANVAPAEEVAELRRATVGSHTCPIKTFQNWPSSKGKKRLKKASVVWQVAIQLLHFSDFRICNNQRQ